MTDLFPYLLKASLVFTVFFVFYKVVLSRLTFHGINRFLLLAFIPISLVIPFSDHLIPQALKTSLEVPFSEHITFNALVEVSPFTHAVQETSINYWVLAMVVYFCIAAFFLFRSSATILKLFRLKNSSKSFIGNESLLIEVKTTQVFSFFNWVFIPEGRSHELDHIILKHEKAHAQLLHSLDIIITELYIACFWFNPFVYAFRRSLKSVHEFQVDSTLTQEYIAPTEYLQLLLKHLTGKKQKAMYNYFNYATLKKRVEMIAKKPSNRYKKWVYLIVFPFSLLVCLAFTNKHRDTPMEVVTIPQQKTSFLFPVKNASPEDISSHFGIKRKILKKKQKRIHQGIDIRAKEGASVIAAADGVVLKASNKGSWGNLIVIQHADGYETWYAHLKGFTISKNQTVKKGDIIGSVGNTGNSYGFHLHFELKYNGIHQNPLHYIKE